MNGEKGDRFHWLLIFFAAGLAFYTTQIWESKEGSLVNFAFPFLGVLTPNIDSLVQKSLKDQVAVLDGVTWKLLLLQRLPRPLISWLFEEMATASKATTTFEFLVPSRDDNRRIPILCVCPQNLEKDARLPLVLHFHHGGLVVGEPRQELIYIQYISYTVSAVVCSVDYRLAPEYPYPAAMNDALDASNFLIHQDGDDRNIIKEKLGVTIDSSKVATFGVSAGGYLAAHITRLLADDGVSLQAQILIAPMVKPHGGTYSMLVNGKSWDWNRHWNTYAWTTYLPEVDGKLANHWTVSLLVDPPGSDDALQRLPPAYIQINKRDVLYDEGKMYAQRLAARGKLLELAEYDTFHVTCLPPFSKGGPAAGAFEKAVNALKKQFQL